MGLFGFGKKKATEAKTTVSQMTNEEKYGKAWLMIVAENQREQGLQIMNELDHVGFVEGSIALSMFEHNPTERMKLVKKAADAGNPEGLWEYCSFLPHSYCPDPNNSADALWEKTCVDAAETGSVDAMNELGNVFNRRNNYGESMYWYAMANANDHHDAMISMRGIAKKWQQAGCPRNFVPGSPKYDDARHKCAIAYLEMHSNEELSATPNEMIPLVLNGVPIAGFFIGDLFECIGNEEMAFRMYNALASENDPHALKCCADMLAAGKGVDRDMQSAVRFYMAAAEAGERSAMFVIGELTRNQNKNLAAYWYGVSHTRGYGLALQRLIQLAQ